MNGPAPQRGNSGFNRLTVLGVVLFGFVAFITMLYFIGAGDTQRRGNDGQAHAAANGLNGYAGLVRLLELEGYDVSTSRSPSGLETDDLLVLTPPPYMDAEELAEIFQERAYAGPTLVILPKWYVTGFPPNLPDEIDGEIEDGWVRLVGASPPGWVKELPEPYGFEIELEEDDGEKGRWGGYDRTGNLPSTSTAFVKPGAERETLVTDESGRTLAFWIQSEDEFGYSEDSWAVTFVVEPDLVNNYGLGDADRAALALKIIDDAGYGEGMPIVFDLTLNGLGGETNLLTLAFRPPFLAATLCLILAMLIVGWRAFMRFGPPVASKPEIAFGKRRLVANGAGLILRARRLRLLAEPYAALSGRRIAKQLGLARPDPEAIDQALSVRFPDEPPYTMRVAELQRASKPGEILRAARALKELEGKLER